jgi:hypothetical protein
MMTPDKDFAHDQFHPNDVIRLIAPHGDYAAGASGHIIGRFARVDPVWVVSFGDGSPCIELRSDEIVLVAAA